MEKYNFSKIEKKWQKIWEKEKPYKAVDFSDNPKYYCLVEFPYPSGEGLHVGHCRSYTALDIIARKKRMQGFNVLFPMGWDAFGLPTENYAIKTGIHPVLATKRNTDIYRKQLKSMGFSFDWQREINTTDPNYYKWTQWIFLKLFENGLAYKSKIPVNWCPSCKIGLANEEVIEGNCERCGTKTEQKEKEQWMIKITEYADRLIEDLKGVDYPERIKTQQINWIGKSHGAEIIFKIEGREEEIKVFTTRPDTIFGVTAVVLAPEHQLVRKITKKHYKEDVERYIEESRRKSEFERTKLEKSKTGVFAGSFCVNPLNNKRVPVWLGDYVVSSYGGGAVMVVPAHDKRDYEFAKKYGIEIKEVIAGGDILKEAFTDYGKLINSEEFTGMKSQEAQEKITEKLEKNNAGKKTVNYKLRDWVFSRQHYWGEPIPLIFCENCKKLAENFKFEILNLKLKKKNNFNLGETLNPGWISLSEDNLPLKLPEIKNYKPTDTGESPLSGVSQWVNVKCPRCQGKAKRETDVMPNWAGSNWYFLRYTDPKNKKVLAGSKNMKYWMPVDLYNGGMEHVTLHLLYSRFIFKFLWDIKAVPEEIGSEPYKKRTAHGMILGGGGIKMSKSKGNVINPNDIIKKYGADTLRLYEMFIGPFEEYVPWDIKGIEGCYRFLQKIWKLSFNLKEKSKETEQLLHKTIKKVAEDIDNMKFNTAVSSMMVLVNEMSEGASIEDFKNLLLILSPFAPHISQELWTKLGFEEEQKWPKYNKKLIKEKKINLIIQVNGKVRDKIEADVDITEEEAKSIALFSEKVVKWIGGKEPKKIIFVPKRLINIVI